MAGSPVYLVDDDANMRELMRLICEDNGMVCRSFAGGEEFIASMDGLDPGCVLLDMRMPRKNGIQVQEEIAARGRRLPVVAISGSSDVETVVQSMRLGAIDFLEKPFEIETLVEALERGLAIVDGGSPEPARTH